MAYKYGIHMTDNDAPAFNACAFATRDEAERAGHELLSRSFAPKRFTIHETDETANYEFPDGIDRPRSIKRAETA